MTFNQFERQVRDAVEAAVPNCYKVTHFASDCGFAKLTTTVQGNIAILYVGTDSALSAETPYVNHMTLHHYDLTEADAGSAAEAIIRCLAGDSSGVSQS